MACNLLLVAAVYLHCLVLIAMISKKNVLHLKILERLSKFEGSGNTNSG